MAAAPYNRARAGHADGGVPGSAPLAALGLAGVRYPR
ncbi:MAG: hypothetical protein DRG58_11830 [Deltaproteobacteria bacterium]|nr:MAG: hypothetical protein DRG58_11830 [Deltaproteobacteria bacterium]